MNWYGQLKCPKKWPNLYQCRDYSEICRYFNAEEMNYFEEQLSEYLGMENITEEYLSVVPMVVCWYEGLLETKDFIEEVMLL
jgi:hypothetical protein